jgi:uncharacterized protein YbaP (TraB family)
MLRSVLAKLAAPFAGVFALGLALGLAAPAAQAEPALWVVKGPHATVYLFGTVHLLKPDDPWMSPKIKQAFDESQDLTLEIAELDDDSAAIPLIQKLGVDPQHPLSGKLSPGDRKRLAAAIKSLQADPAGFEMFKPWLAAVLLSELPLEKKGFDPKQGVDRTLERAAKAKGEKVLGFETMEQQLGYFADMPQTQQLSFLHESLKDFPEIVPELSKLAQDWEEGKVDAIGKEMNADMQKEDPKLYDLLITKRNEAFAAAIAKKLETGSGTSFVAVGAGHLAGSDSIQVQLEKLGYKATRL